MQAAVEAKEKGTSGELCVKVVSKVRCGAAGRADGEIHDQASLILIVTYLPVLIASNTALRWSQNT